MGKSSLTREKQTKKTNYSVGGKFSPTLSWSSLCLNRSGVHTHMHTHTHTYAHMLSCNATNSCSHIVWLYSRGLTCVLHVRSGLTEGRCLTQHTDTLTAGYCHTAHRLSMLTRAHKRVRTHWQLFVEIKRCLDVSNGVCGTVCQQMCEWTGMELG